MTNKKMLLIAPVFFDYYKEIIRAAENYGWNVTYVCDAPSNSSFSKAVGRINKKLIKYSAQKHFEKNLRILNKDQFDVVLVIGGMTFGFTPQMMEELKTLQARAKFVMYQWDSERNLPYAPFIHHVFDEIFTFDRADVESNDKYRFLPLFYSDSYAWIASNRQKSKYDCVYIGTAHPEKYSYINTICDSIKEIAPRQYIYHYMPSKLKFWFQKIKYRSFWRVKATDLDWEKLDQEHIKNILSYTGCILDAPQKGQSGLTMRTIECLGAKKKLITTNSDIVNYDFYNPNNIWVYSENHIPDRTFFRNEYEELPVQIYKKYSIHEWLKTMLDL